MADLGSLDLAGEMEMAMEMDTESSLHVDVAERLFNSTQLTELAVPHIDT